jgi:hypothetical protein
MTASAFLQSAAPIKTKVNASDFAVPTGYKVLKNVEEISDVNSDTMQLFGN